MPPTPPSALLAWDRRDLGAWLRLALTPGVGNASARRLLARFGSPGAALEQPLSALQSCLRPEPAERLRHPSQALQEQIAAAVATTWDWLQAGSGPLAHALLTPNDPRYPASLLQIADPPLLLYAVGQARWLLPPAPLLPMARNLAIVGSRNPTAQGLDNARRFAQTLAEHGACIISGLALGIDGAAHAGALASLDAPGAAPRTVAVLGTGVDLVYPRRHAGLARRIAEQGLLLSEFPLGTAPIASHFPQRNRLIAGLAAGTLVVEAAELSGSLITAQMAVEQGREVFAIPGSIHAPQSRGCHALLRQGACLVETAADIWRELPGLVGAPAPGAAESGAAAPGAMAPEPIHPLLPALGQDPIGLDALCANTGWPIAELQAALLELELAGQVARLPGGWFQRRFHG